MIRLILSNLFGRIHHFLEFLFSDPNCFNIVLDNIFWNGFFMGLEYNVPEHSFHIPHFVSSLRPDIREPQGLQDTSEPGDGYVAELAHQQAKEWTKGTVCFWKSEEKIS